MHVPVATTIFLERDNKVFEHYKHPALSQVYDENTNPTGVRCSLQDYMVNVFGRRLGAPGDAAPGAGARVARPPRVDERYACAASPEVVGPGRSAKKNRQGRSEPARL
jgi:hypothetical protein